MGWTCPAASGQPSACRAPVDASSQAFSPFLNSQHRPLCLLRVQDRSQLPKRCMGSGLGIDLLRNDRHRLRQVTMAALYHRGIISFPMSSSPDRSKSWAAQPNAQSRSSEADQAAAVTLRSLQARSDHTGSLLLQRWLKRWYPPSQTWLRFMVCKVLANIKMARSIAKLA